MAKRTKTTETEEVIEIPPIEISDDIEATYQSVLMHLFMMQAKFQSLDHNPVDFVGYSMTPVQAYLNLVSLWEVDALGPAPTLEQVCQQYWMGPPFIDRLRWYAEGAQLSENRWNPDDPDWREPEDDDVDGADAMPLISTGGERVGPDDAPPFEAGDTTWSATAWEDELEKQAIAEWPVNEAGVKYNPQTGEIIDDDPFDVGDAQAGDAAGQADDTNINPPSWLAQGGWPAEMPMKALNSPVSLGQPFSPEERPEAVCMTVVVAFNEPVPRPITPCSKDVWSAYVQALEARYRELLASKEAILQTVNDEIEMSREEWKAAREDKTSWKK